MRAAAVAVLPLAVLATAEAAPSMTVELVHRPTLDRSEGTALRYELRIGNPSPRPVTVTGLRISDERGRRLAALSGEALAAASDRAGSGNDTVAIASRSSVTLFIDLDLADRAPPQRLRHIASLLGAGNSAAFSANRVVTVDRSEPAALGPPLRGGPWVAVHSPAWPRGHRRVFYTEAGRARLPGRYAIDFVGVTASGAITRGNPDRPADAVGYGEEVIAVADAVVVRVRDGMAESASIAANPDHVAEAAGNHVVLALGRGRYAFYEHLRPGSIRVRVGERVRRGEVLGALGFTGDSTGPHLHFHVADAPSPLGGEGLPFVIDSYRQCGRYPDIGALGKAPWTTQPTGARAGQRPGSNVVVAFGDAAECTQSSATIPAKSAA